MTCVRLRKRERAEKKRENNREILGLESREASHNFSKNETCVFLGLGLEGFKKDYITNTYILKKNIFVYKLFGWVRFDRAENTSASCSTQ